MVVAGNRVFRESAVPEVCYPRRTLLGSLVNRGNGAALSGDCPGIYERRGKDSNLRGLTPTPQLGHLRKPGPDRRRTTFPRERAWLALRLRCAWFFFTALNVPTCSYRPLAYRCSTTVQLS